MKAPTKYASKQDNPAVVGNLSIEEIVRADWERNYAPKKLLELDALRTIVKDHVESGGDVFRFRNTLFLVTPEDGYQEVKFHTLTADVFEVYMTLLVMFLAALNKAQGTEIAYTYIPDKTVYRAGRKWFGDAAEIEKADEDGDADYKVTIDVAEFVAKNERLAAAQGR